MGGYSGRALALTLAVLTAAFAGCATDDASVARTTTDAGEPSASTNETTPGPDAADGNATALAPPEPVEIPLQLDGKLGTAAFACGRDVPGSCFGAMIDDRESGLRVDGILGTVTAARVTVTWNASSPLTERLAVGVMTMWPECEECENVHFGEVEGASPLEIDVAGLTAPLAPDAVIHVYVYQPAPFYEPAYVQATVDQPFTLDGFARVTPAPDAA